MGQAHGCHPDCQRAMDAQDHNASESAAMVAVNLISSARVLLKLDDEYTEYSAQFLVDNARVKKESGEGELDELSVKNGLKFALKEGIPKREHWGHLGCVFKVPPFACHIPRVSMKGEVIETKDLEEALKMLMQQPLGARLHVFSPAIENVGDGIYYGMSNDGSSYVGLRDVIIFGVNKIEGKLVADVKICYKKKTSFIKVSLNRMFLQAYPDSSRDIPPTGLLVDFCAPRLSIE